jgi:two-component system KDP operon response regulator KdpE
MTDRGLCVLLVEDDAHLRLVVRATLVAHGYHLIEAGTLAEAEQHATRDAPDLVLLDLGLPDGDGLEFARRLRRRSSVPIIVVSARSCREDQAEALEAGADEYLAKPFSVNELLALIEASLRRASRRAAQVATSTLAIGQLSLDLSRREVTLGGKPIDLTPAEFRLLVLLARNAGSALTFRTIVRELWGRDAPRDAPEEVLSVRVHVAELRKKLEADPVRPRVIVTEQGVGYRLHEEENGASAERP